MHTHPYTHNFPPIHTDCKFSQMIRGCLWVGVQLSSLVEAQKLFSFWPGTNFQEAGNLSSLQEFSFFLLHFSLSLSFQFHFPFSFHISPLAVGANIYPVIPNYTCTFPACVCVFVYFLPSDPANLLVTPAPKDPKSRSKTSKDTSLHLEKIYMAGRKSILNL